MQKKTLKNYLTAVLMAAGLVLLDQLTKRWAASALAEKPIELIPGVFSFQYLENHGAAFGILQNQRWFFLVLTGVFMAAMVFAYYKLPGGRRHFPLRILCVTVLAGALGNFIDRLSYGYVRDFLYFKLIDFPIFNVADIYVTLSALAFIILFLFVYKDEDFRFRKKTARP
jgi:signal peptidase II